MVGLPKILIIAGGVLLSAGLILYFFSDKLHFLGRLPGDIRIEKENFKFYFPITTGILISIVLSLILWIVRKF